MEEQEHTRIDGAEATLCDSAAGPEFATNGELVRIHG